MHCKSLWIKASAKCINVNVYIRSYNRHLSGKWLTFKIKCVLHGISVFQSKYIMAKPIAIRCMCIHAGQSWATITLSSLNWITSISQTNAFTWWIIALVWLKKNCKSACNDLSQPLTKLHFMQQYTNGMVTFTIDICHCSPIGIHVNRNFTYGQNISPHRFHIWFKY